MAFGKKKDEAAPAAVTDEAAAAESAAPDEELEATFASAEGQPPEEAVGPDTAAAVAPEAPADALAGGADALLSAFTTTQIETEDKSVLIDLAGEHDLDDLLEELHTVAAAMGIVLEDDEYDEEAA
jgi:hypothetical protein